MKIHHSHLNLKKVAGNSQAAGTFLILSLVLSAISLDRLPGLTNMSSNFQGNFMQMNSSLSAPIPHLENGQMTLTILILMHARRDSSSF